MLTIFERPRNAFDSALENCRHPDLYAVLIRAGGFPNRDLMPSWRTLPSTTRTWRSSSMLDLVFLALGLGGFALMGAYAALCDRL
ncbi:MAG: hypothetical protein JNL45_08660 [Hyphomicrobium sp.]|nr:hypothetical protein [Hyphomicrobium sp.]